MKNITENIRLYVGAWSEKTPETIKAMLLECCSPDVTYTDKQTPLIAGIDELTRLIMRSYQVVPGRIITLLSEPECFGHHAYYAWGIQIPGSDVRTGRDYMTYNQEQLITNIVGFLPVS